MLNMVKNASVQATDIYKDPYGYTYSEMVGVLGEVEADKFYRELYSGSQSSNKYKTITIKEIFRGPDTQKYAFELSDGYCIETVSITMSSITAIMWMLKMHEMKRQGTRSVTAPLKIC